MFCFLFCFVFFTTVCTMRQQYFFYSFTLIWFWQFKPKKSCWQISLVYYKGISLLCRKTNMYCQIACIFLMYFLIFRYVRAVLLVWLWHIMYAHWGVHCRLQSMQIWIWNVETCVRLHVEASVLVLSESEALSIIFHSLNLCHHCTWFSLFFQRISFQNYSIPKITAHQYNMPQSHLTPRSGAPYSL